MNRLPPILLTLLMAALARTAPAVTVTAPLEFSAVTDDAGEHWVGSFDLGVRFASIEEAYVDFTLDQTYEGAAVTTGNSSYSSLLAVTLAGGGADTTAELLGANHFHFFNEIPPRANLFYAPGGESVRARLSPVLVVDTVGTIDPKDGVDLVLNSTDDVLSSVPVDTIDVVVPYVPVQVLWPDDLYEGQGVVAMGDVRYHSTHPLPSSEVTSSSRTLALPATGVTGVTLTVIGTLVPEPSTAALIAFATVAMPARRCRRA